MARHGGVCALGVQGCRAGAAGGVVLGGQPQQRRGVARRVRAGRRRQVAEDAVAEVRPHHELREPCAVEVDAVAEAVGIERRAAQRLPVERGCQPSDHRQHVARRAAQSTRADGAPSRADARRLLALERVEAVVDRERAVQHDRTDEAGVADGERLRGIGAVRVAVHVDPSRAQAGEDRRDVVDRRRGAVRVRGVAEQPRAPAGRVRVVAGSPLQLGAVDCAGRAGATEVDGDQVVALRQRAQQEAVHVGGRRRCEPRSALDPQHRLQGRLRGVGAAVDLEVDGDRPQRRPAPVERHGERSAQHARIARARCDLDAAGCRRGAGDGHQGQRCERDQEPAEHTMTIRGPGCVR